MKQLTPMGLVKILAQVTAIMVIPMVGGAVAGIMIDMSPGNFATLRGAGFAPRFGGVRRRDLVADPRGNARRASGAKPAP